jgi:hypothetical protein
MSATVIAGKGAGSPWRSEVLVFAGAAFMLCAAALAAAPPILKQEPPPGSLAAGQVVYVEDGSCPAGQIKQVTGGANRDATGNSIPGAAARQRQCVINK